MNKPKEDCFWSHVPMVFPGLSARLLSTRWKNFRSQTSRNLQNVRRRPFAKLLRLPRPLKVSSTCDFVLFYDGFALRGGGGLLRRTGLHSPEFKRRELDVRARARVKHQMQPRFVSSLLVRCIVPPRGTYIGWSMLAFCLAYTLFAAESSRCSGVASVDVQGNKQVRDGLPGLHSTF
ncbi:hypothetical protein BDP81DRAFT_86293 [Colletotrichum phormii]|uniref:Uncharacterized protein n=1 Tax=Colletotrichum phormii TaxID=359342 RepID=A0AAJ0A4V5_9PEZI|nr:uncharacterized protein BDP81DRAFT_86293 [Colletotrichum phormii]KAK1654640.1 hypothetical protein BDP81DRAFT_86293 [Colletotrichum phormii]